MSNADAEQSNVELAARLARSIQTHEPLPAVYPILELEDAYEI